VASDSAPSRRRYFFNTVAPLKSVEKVPSAGPQARFPLWQFPLSTLPQPGACDFFNTGAPGLVLKKSNSAGAGVAGVLFQRGRKANTGRSVEKSRERRLSVSLKCVARHHRPSHRRERVQRIQSQSIAKEQPRTNL
jgi:hypothetical protein